MVVNAVKIVLERRLQKTFRMTNNIKPQDLLLIKKFHRINGSKRKVLKEQQILGITICFNKVLRCLIVILRHSKNSILWLKLTELTASGQQKTTQTKANPHQHSSNVLQIYDSKNTIATQIVMSNYLILLNSILNSP